MKLTSLTLTLAKILQLGGLNRHIRGFEQAWQSSMKDRTALNIRFKYNLAMLGLWGCNFILSVLALILFWKNPRKFNPRTVLVHHIGNIGDTVVAVPTLMGIKFSVLRKLVHTVFVIRKEHCTV